MTSPIEVSVSLRDQANSIKGVLCCTSPLNVNPLLCPGQHENSFIVAGGALSYMKNQVLGYLLPGPCIVLTD